MTKYIISSIIGVFISLVLGFFLTPFLSVIIGAFIAGSLCEGRASGGAQVVFLMGIIYSIPVYLFAGFVVSMIPILGVIIRNIGIGIMFVLNGLGILGGTLGGFVNSKHHSSG